MNIYRHSLSFAFAGLSLLSSSQAALWTSGHGDIGLEGDGGVLELEYHVGEGEAAIVDGVEVFDTGYEPDELQVGVFHRQVINSTNTELLDGLGISSGDSLSFLTNSEIQAESLGTPVLGFGAEELDSSDWGDVTFSLTGISGPGDFSLYQADGLGGANFFMSTALGGITSDDSVTIPAGIHDDYIFAFTEEGIYNLTIEASALYIPDNEVRTTSSTFTFVVPEPSTAILGLLGFAPLLRRRRA